MKVSNAELVIGWLMILAFCVFCWVQFEKAYGGEVWLLVIILVIGAGLIFTRRIIK